MVFRNFLVAMIMMVQVWDLHQHSTIFLLLLLFFVTGYDPFQKWVSAVLNLTEYTSNCLGSLSSLKRILSGPFSHFPQTQQKPLSAARRWIVVRKLAFTLALNRVLLKMDFDLSGNSFLNSDPQSMTFQTTNE